MRVLKSNTTTNTTTKTGWIYYVHYFPSTDTLVYRPFTVRCWLCGGTWRRHCWSGWARTLQRHLDAAHPEVVDAGGAS